MKLEAKKTLAILMIFFFSIPAIHGGANIDGKKDIVYENIGNEINVDTARTVAQNKLIL